MSTVAQKEAEVTKKVFHQFFCSRPVISITMTNGKRIRFVAGRYVTDAEDEVAFLQNEVRQKHRMIYVKKGEETVTETDLDPLAALREKFFAEFEARQKSALDPKNDMGNTTQQTSKSANAGAATSRSIAEMAAQVSSVGATK